MKVPRASALKSVIPGHSVPICTPPPMPHGGSRASKHPTSETSDKSRRLGQISG